ncbi:hypothetical protein EHQ17_11050 [Leptospira gomenensis]|uniref:Uncharacterized protein n=1 Tax=Leptospira gomenensis TaxID=2484974 RepID=A0A5F1Y9S8_9LEPT|nr:hypothetical protein [Leptospira gomenensis]TGK33323.1 hypothetical protein EHQ17_11050 [Leptospira gomenensis]
MGTHTESAWYGDCSAENVGTHTESAWYGDCSAENVGTHTESAWYGDCSAENVGTLTHGIRVVRGLFGLKTWELSHTESAWVRGLFG